MPLTTCPVCRHVETHVHPIADYPVQFLLCEACAETMARHLRTAQDLKALAMENARDQAKAYPC